MQYGPVKHWVKRKSTSHPPTKSACVCYCPWLSQGNQACRINVCL